MMALTHHKATKMIYTSQEQLLVHPEEAVDQIDRENPHNRQQDRTNPEQVKQINLAEAIDKIDKSHWKS